VGDAIEHAEREVSDADRERAAAVLRVAAGRGRIDIHELDDRLGDVFKARTIGQLASVTWDLDHPGEAAPPAPPRGPRMRRGMRWRNAGYRAHAWAYILTNGFLFGTWAITTPGGFPWFFFPAGGWGIGLGMHAWAATESERKKLETEQRQQAKMVRVPPAALGGADRPLPPAPKPARRFVVAMFTDIAGSTRLNEALGDAEWVRVRSHHRALLQECFSSGGGYEVNALGDGFLARFDTPAAAVRCAVAIQERLEKQRGDTGFAPSVRIGIHSGDAVEDGGDLLGAVINLAARVTSAAEPGEIIVTEPVADHLGERFDTEDRGLVTLKGVGQPRHLLAVAWRA
jgi:class 3 adenylate cyclase